MRKLIVVFLLVSCTPKYTIQDYHHLQQLLLEQRTPTKQELKQFDLNNDGILNASDYVALANKLKRSD